jgi:hypothetical protein
MRALPSPSAPRPPAPAGGRSARRHQPRCGLAVFSLAPFGLGAKSERSQIPVPWPVFLSCICHWPWPRTDAGSPFSPTRAFSFSSPLSLFRLPSFPRSITPIASSRVSSGPLSSFARLNFVFSAEASFLASPSAYTPSCLAQS